MMKDYFDITFLEDEIVSFRSNFKHKPPNAKIKKMVSLWIHLNMKKTGNDVLEAAKDKKKLEQAFLEIKSFETKEKVTQRDLAK